jgi:hypothetical protein
VYSPVSGTVLETNAALADTPALVRPSLLMMHTWRGQALFCAKALCAAHFV